MTNKTINEPRPGIEPAGMSDGEGGVILALSDAPPMVGYAGSVVITSLATILAVGIDSEVTIPNLSLLFVLPVILMGIGFGIGPSVFSAVLGALAYNYFLTEPRFSLTVNDPADVWAIGLLFLVGLIVSGISFIARRRAADAARLRRQAGILQKFSQSIVAAEDEEGILTGALDALHALFEVPAVLLQIADGQIVSTMRVGDVEPTDADLEAARSVSGLHVASRAGVYPELESRLDFWPVAIDGGRASVVIGLAFVADDRPAAPSLMVDVIASLLGIALDRNRLRTA